jgi:hypothetical protein
MRRPAKSPFICAANIVCTIEPFPFEDPRSQRRRLCFLPSAGLFSLEQFLGYSRAPHADAWRLGTEP